MSNVRTNGPTDPDADVEDLNVIRTERVGAGSRGPASTIDAARQLGLSVLVENQIEDGRVLLEVSVYDVEVCKAERDIDEWWELPPGWGTPEQSVSDDDQDIFGDPRWEMFAARAFWLRITDYSHDPEDNAEGILMWVVEFSDVSIARR